MLSPHVKHPQSKVSSLLNGKTRGDLLPGAGTRNNVHSLCYCLILHYQPIQPDTVKHLQSRYQKRIEKYFQLQIIWLCDNPGNQGEAFIIRNFGKLTSDNINTQISRCPIYKQRPAQHNGRQDCIYNSKKDSAMCRYKSGEKCLRPMWKMETPLDDTKGS